MPDKDKIRSMTELASFSKKHRAEISVISDYYKLDYMISQFFQSFVRFTLCFMIFVVMYVIFNSNTLFYNINISGITETLMKMLMLYLMLLAAYLIITAVVCSIKYDRAEMVTDEYVIKLSRLNRRFRGKRRQRT
ncbi:MAG: hypothetical protein Q4B67_07300 [Eubacteriales bacterium]|nr:hypothetical protein [Eubacteriales bacterium]